MKLFLQKFVRPRLATFGWLLASVTIPSQLGAAPAAANAAAVSQELQDAIRSLKSSDDAVRRKAYDLIRDKGDARLIPPLLAYRDGRLQDLNGRLIVYGDPVDLNGQKGFPRLDAFTGLQLTKPDGSPDYLLHKSIDLSAPGMMRLPPARRAERATIADLVSTLSLLDPDPAVRLQSIRDTGERAAKAFPDGQDQARFVAKLNDWRAALAAMPPQPHVSEAIAAIDVARNGKATTLTGASPNAAAVQNVISALSAVRTGAPDGTPLAARTDLWIASARTYHDQLDLTQKNLDDLPKYSAALHRQLAKDPNGRFSDALREATAEMDVVLSDGDGRLAAVKLLGAIGTERADNILGKTVDAARRNGDPALLAVAEPALARADRYQARVGFAQQTFAGLSLGSILVLMALGLSIVFGLMDVINMAHGEFMMIGAFTTFVVSEWFKHLPAGYYDYYPLVAIPAAFLAAAAVGYVCELLIIRHLYGRPLETLLSTFGLGLVLIWAARSHFGDSLSVKPPSWMEGGWEVVPDLFLARNRLYIVVYCLICITAVYLVVNRTKMGLLLRATTQNRQMAAALGVPTRRVDGLTFAFGCGLAGLAGVAVPLYNKINPGVGQEYIVDSFMVVVLGGVGALSGAIWAGLALGFLSKYLEPLLASFPAFASSSSVIAKVLVLAAIVVFLTRRPQGLFPPKGRTADA